MKSARPSYVRELDGPRIPYLLEPGDVIATDRSAYGTQTPFVLSVVLVPQFKADCPPVVVNQFGIQTRPIMDEIIEVHPDCPLAAGRVAYDIYRRHTQRKAVTA